MNTFLIKVTEFMRDPDLARQVVHIALSDELPPQLNTPICRSSQRTRRFWPGASSESGQTSMTVDKGVMKTYWGDRISRFGV